MTTKEITKQRIAVMQAFVEGKAIDSYVNGVLVFRNVTHPLWDWDRYDYRIRPTPLEGYARVIETGHSGTPVRFGGLYADKAKCEDMARRCGSGRVVKFREVIEEN